MTVIPAHVPVRHVAGKCVCRTISSSSQSTPCASSYLSQFFFSGATHDALLHYQHHQPQIKPQIHSNSDPHPILIRKALSASRVHLLLGSSITHTLWWLTQSLSSRLPFLPLSSSNFNLLTNFFFRGCALFWFDRLVLAGSKHWKRWKWLVPCSTKDLRVKVDSKKRNKRP